MKNLFILVLALFTSINCMAATYANSYTTNRQSAADAYARGLSVSNAIVSGTATNAAVGGNILTTNVANIVFTYFSDTNLEPYFQTVGLSDFYLRQNLRDWSTALQKAGIFTNLLDAAFLNTNYQPAMISGNQPLTYFGKHGTNTVATAMWTDNGIICAGTNNWVFSLRRNVTNFTLLVCYQQDPTWVNSGAESRAFCVKSPGYPTSNNVVFLSQMADGVGNLTYYYTYNESYAGNSFIINPNNTVTNQGINCYDYRRQTIALAAGPSGASWSRDGCPGDSTTWTAGNYPTNLGLLEFSYTSYNGGTSLAWKGNVIGWMLFDRQLTFAEQTAAWDAMSYTTLAEENIVVMGDSLSFQRTSAGFTGYTNSDWSKIAFWDSGLAPKNVNLFNVSMSGGTAGNFLITQTNFVRTLYAPHGRFKKTTEYISLGMNNNWGATDLTLATNAYVVLTNLWSLAQAEGISKLVAFTWHCPDSNSWTLNGMTPPIVPGMSNSIIQMNALIRSDPSKYNELVQIDRVLTQTATNYGFTLDGLHANYYGNYKMAQEVKQRGQTSIGGGLFYGNGVGLTNHLGFATNTPVVVYCHVTNGIATWTTAP